MLSFGQTICDTTRYPKLLGNSFQCKWAFFKLSDTTQGIVIKYEKQSTPCGVLATASLAIIKTKQDTIRVIALCDENNYRVGQKVKLIPANEPSFQVNIPSYYDYFDKTKKKYYIRSNSFDETVVRTTWAHINLTK